MEETIGYEALFSAQEWHAIQTGDWSDVPDEDWGSPKEGGPAESTKHSVFIGYPPGQYEGNQHKFELECDVCDHLGAVETVSQARAVRLLHQRMEALIETRKVGS